MKTARWLSLLLLTGFGGALLGAAGVDRLSTHEFVKADAMRTRLDCHDWASSGHWDCVSAPNCLPDAREEFQLHCLRLCNEELAMALQRCSSGQGRPTQAEMDRLLRWLHTDAGRPYAPEDWLNSDASAPSTPEPPRR